MTVELKGKHNLLPVKNQVTEKSLFIKGKKNWYSLRMYKLMPSPEKIKGLLNGILFRDEIIASFWLKKGDLRLILGCFDMEMNPLISKSDNIETSLRLNQKPFSRISGYYFERELTSRFIEKVNKQQKALLYAKDLSNKERWYFGFIVSELDFERGSFKEVVQQFLEAGGELSITIIKRDKKVYFGIFGLITSAEANDLREKLAFFKEVKITNIKPLKKSDLGKFSSQIALGISPLLFPDLLSIDALNELLILCQDRDKEVQKEIGQQEIPLPMAEEDEITLISGVSKSNLQGNSILPTVPFPFSKPKNKPSRVKDVELLRIKERAIQYFINQGYHYSTRFPSFPLLFEKGKGLIAIEVIEKVDVDFVRNLAKRLEVVPRDVSDFQVIVFVKEESKNDFLIDSDRVLIYPVTSPLVSS